MADCSCDRRRKIWVTKDLCENTDEVEKYANHHQIDLVVTSEGQSFKNSPTPLSSRRILMVPRMLYGIIRFMNHPAPANSRYKPTCYEHAANCYTHAFLIFPAIVGSALLHRLSEDQWEKITAWIYGVGLCALFIVSTVFHIISWKKSHLRTMEHCFHMCDRMMIYIFIAASYAPWLNLRELGPLASHMRWFIWLMAAGGAFYVFHYHEKYKIVELFFYLAMGFSPALVVTSMNNTEGLQELAWGGVIYCMGVIFFKSDGIIPFAHAIWHLFVATAAAVHYYAIWKYLYRSPADIILQL